jgi:hypothetical protein
MTVTTGDTALTAAQLAEAREWIYDSYEDAPEDLTDAEVTAAVRRHYDGGLAAFLSDTAALADGDRQ